MKNVFVLLLLIAASSTSLFSQAEASATATATAEIIQAIEISKTADMNFGNIAVSATVGGSVTLAPDGSRTPFGGVTLPASAGTVTAASFLVTGVPEYAYSITLPTGHTIVHTTTTDEMELEDFTSDPEDDGELDGAGEQVVNVGATLLITAGQAAGVYTSVTPFTVTVNYN